MEIKSYDFYKGLEKHEIKDIIRSIFEKGVLKNSEPLKVEFVKHVISDSGSYGTSVPVATWKGMLNILNFRETSSSSSGWSHHAMENIMLSYLESVDYANGTIEHSISVHCRKTSGGFSYYHGNVEDLFEQISSVFNITRLNSEFNI